MEPLHEQMIVDLQTHEQGNSQGYDLAQYPHNEE